MSNDKADEPKRCENCGTPVAPYHASNHFCGLDTLSPPETELVTQADRDAAADLYHYFNHRAERIDPSSLATTDPVLQAFAARARAALASIPETPMSIDKADELWNSPATLSPPETGEPKADELLPCPRCGQSGPTKVWRERHLPDGTEGIGELVRCVCGMQTARLVGEGAAVEVWNTRTLSPPETELSAPTRRMEEILNAKLTPRKATPAPETGELVNLAPLDNLLRYHETGGHEGDGSDHALREARAALASIPSVSALQVSLERVRKDSVNAQIALLERAEAAEAENERLRADRQWWKVERLQAEITAWGNAAGGLDAYLADRINNDDPPSWEKARRILEIETKDLELRSRQIYAASQARAQRATARAEAAEARYAAAEEICKITQTRVNNLEKVVARLEGALREAAAVLEGIYHDTFDTMVHRDLLRKHAEDGALAARSALKGDG